MSDPTPSVIVSTDDALDDVIRRLRDAAGRGTPVVLVVPFDSSLLLTAAEFRHLKDAIDRDRLAVTVRSLDPLRLQLARLLGVPAAPVVTAPQADAPAPPDPPRTAAPSRIPTAARPAATATAPATRTTAKTAARAPAPAKPAKPAKPARAPVRPRLAAPQPAASAAKEAAAEPTGGAAAGAPAAPAAPPEIPGAAPARESSDAAEAPDTHWPEPPTPEALAEARRNSGLLAAVRRRAGRTPASPLAAAPAPAEPEREDAVAPSASAAGGSVEADEARPMVIRPAPERRRRRALAAGAVAAALVVAAVAAFFLLPAADVVVALKRQPLTGEVVYDVTQSGAPLDANAAFALAAVPAATTVTWDGEIPVTGVRREPDATAAGPILFANPTAAELTVEAGTELTTETGVAFVVAAAVTVPPADPATGRPGTVEGQVRAAKPGEGGNVGTGEIGGKLPNGVYFSNRERGTGGGTDRKIPVVAAADLETLRAKAAAAFADQAAAAFAKSLPRGKTPLPSTFAAGTPQETFSAGVGAETPTLSLRTAWQASALVSDAATAERGIADALAKRLGAAVPAGYDLDPASIKTATPIVVEQTPNGARYRLPATAQAVARFGDEERRALTARLAGADGATVDALLRSVPQIDAYRVSYRPAWFASRMPSNAARIAIEVE